MRKLVVLTFLSLDGVMQAPGGKGEDPSGGFDLEGWIVPYVDDVFNEQMGKQMGQPFELLVGKNTFDIFAGYWPKKGDEDVFKDIKKYVVSNNAPVDTSWKETIPIKGDAVAEIKKLKKQDGPMLQVHGSGNLIQTLLKNDLVDELWLKIFPVTLGKGKRLFGEGTIPAAFKLTSSVVSPSGVFVANYQRAGDPKLGSFE